MSFDIREYLAFSRNGRAYCPSCERKKGRRPTQRSLAIVPGTDGAYHCHAGCTPSEIRQALGHPPSSTPSQASHPLLLRPTPQIYPLPQVQLYSQHLLQGQDFDALQARRWLLNRGLLPPLLQHFKLGLLPGAIAIPLPLDHSHQRFYLKLRIAPWKPGTAWSQRGIPAQVFFTHHPPTASATWLCEGEWDALRLGWLLHQAASPDIAVATFTCGCGGIPGPDQLDRLPGAVVIFYDRDTAGEQGALKLAKTLGTRGRIAQVPAPADAPPGWDISDALAHGTTLAHLHQAAAQAASPQEDTDYQWHLRKGEPRENLPPLQRVLEIEKSRSGCNSVSVIELDPEDYSWSHHGELGGGENGSQPLSTRLLKYLKAHQGTWYEPEELTHEFANTTRDQVRKALERWQRQGVLEAEERVKQARGVSGKQRYKVYCAPCDKSVLARSRSASGGGTLVSSPLEVHQREETRSPQGFDPLAQAPSLTAAAPTVEPAPSKDPARLDTPAPKVTYTPDDPF